MGQEAKRVQVPTSDGGFLSFLYKYSCANLVRQNFHEYENISQELAHFVPSVYLSLYFKQLVAQHTLAYFVISNRNEITRDTEVAFSLWTCVLKTLR